MFKNGHLVHKNKVEEQIEYTRIVDNNYILGNNKANLSPYDIYNKGIIPTKNLLLKYIDLKQKPDIKIDNQEKIT